MPFILDKSPIAGAAGNALQGFMQEAVRQEDNAREDARFEASMALEQQKLQASIQQSQSEIELRKELARVQAQLERSSQGIRRTQVEGGLNLGGRELDQRGSEFGLSMAQRRDEFDRNMGFSQAEADRRRGEFGASLGLSQQQLEQRRVEFEAQLGLSTQEMKFRQSAHEDEMSWRDRRMAREEALDYERLNRQFPEEEMELRATMAKLQEEQVQLQADLGMSVMGGAAATAFGGKAGRGIMPQGSVHTPPIEQWMSPSDQAIYANIKGKTPEAQARAQAHFSVMKRMAWHAEQEAKSVAFIDSTLMALEGSASKGNNAVSAADLEEIAELKENGQIGDAKIRTQRALNKWTHRAQEIQSAKSAREAGEKAMRDTTENLFEPNLYEGQTANLEKGDPTKHERIAQLLAQLARVEQFGQDPDNPISMEAAAEEILSITQGKSYQKQKADRRKAEDRELAEIQQRRNEEFARKQVEMTLGSGIMGAIDRGDAKWTSRMSRLKKKSLPFDTWKTGKSDRTIMSKIARLHAAGQNGARAFQEAALSMGLNDEDDGLAAALSDPKWGTDAFRRSMDSGKDPALDFMMGAQPPEQGDGPLSLPRSRKPK